LIIYKNLKRNIEDKSERQREREKKMMKETNNSQKDKSTALNSSSIIRNKLKKSHVKFDESTVQPSKKENEQQQQQQPKFNRYEKRKSKPWINRFLDIDEQYENAFKLNSFDVLKLTFKHSLDVIYRKDVSKIDKLRHVLQSSHLDLFIIILVILDCFSVMFELMADLKENKSKAWLLAEDCIEYLGITILCLFLVEIILKIVLIPRIFFRSKLEIFDAIVVVMSLVLEITFSIIELDYNGIGAVITILR
jgi:hypothetical protein